jgi:hypothetical protein
VLFFEEAESYRLMEKELERLHQDRLETRVVFQGESFLCTPSVSFKSLGVLEFLNEREEERNEIISALRERSTK